MWFRDSARQLPFVANRRGWRPFGVTLARDNTLSVPLKRVREISRAVIAEHDRTIDVLRVVSSDSDSDRVELLITLSGCHEEPCTLMLNLQRSNPKNFERELRNKLQEKMLQHANTPPASGS